MAILKWLPDALDDLKRLHAFIEPHSLQAATRAVNTLIEAADTLVEFPHKGRPWDLETDFRELPVRFGARGYVIRYRCYEDQVIIVRVWHALEYR
jgi:plasmid stabilization system protein ParE